MYFNHKGEREGERAILKREDEKKALLEKYCTRLRDPFIPINSASERGREV